MRKQLQHKRFRMLIDLLSSTECHWYVQANYCIEPIGSSNDDIHKRPDYVHT
jgi:hypothetical protein